MREAKKTEIERGREERERESRERIKRMREKKRKAEGEVVWRRQNQEDKKEMATHRYERQRE